MKLKQVILKNFGVFKTPRYVDVDDDLVVIYGANFSGKTTLARAIYFALCGRALTTGLKSQNLIAPREFSATTGIVYTHDQETYRLYRSTKGDIRLEQFQQQHWRELDHERLTLPALNPPQWQIGGFLQEHEVGEFLTKAPATRRDLLNQILGVDQLRTVQDAFIKIRRLAKRLEKTGISRQSGLRLDHASDCGKEVETYRRKVLLLEEQLKHQPQDANDQQELSQEWEQRKQQLEQQLQNLTTQYQEQLSGFAKPEELHAALQQINTHLANREQAVAAAEASTEQRIRLEAQLQSTEEQLATLHDLRGQGHCPTCLQPLSEDHLHLLQTRFQEQQQQLVNELNNIREEEQEQRDTLKLLEELTQRRRDVQRRIENIEMLERNLADIRPEYEKLRARLAAVENPTAEREQRKLHKELEQARERLKDLETQQALFHEHRQQIESVNAHAARATRHRFLSEWAADAVEQTMQAVIGTSLHRAETSVIECLREFNLLEGKTKIDLEGSRLMPDLDGRAFHALSGSEKTILYLSIKLAVARLMPGADFLVLDDPTQHLDAARRQQLRDVLLNLIPHKQIILLTNDAAFADMLPEGKRIDLNGS